jgi:hypothetical protein
MDVLTETEIDTIVSGSRLVKKYSEEIDSISAYELLNAKIQEAAEQSAIVAQEAPKGKEEDSMLEKIMDNSVVRQIGRTAASIITRSLLGALGLGGRSRRR